MTKPVNFNTLVITFYNYINKYLCIKSHLHDMFKMYILCAFYRAKKSPLLKTGKACTRTRIRGSILFHACLSCLVFMYIALRSIHVLKYKKTLLSSIFYYVSQLLLHDQVHNTYHNHYIAPFLTRDAIHAYSIYPQFQHTSACNQLCLYT